MFPLQNWRQPTHEHLWVTRRSSPNRRLVYSIWLVYTDMTSDCLAAGGAKAGATEQKTQGRAEGIAGMLGFPPLLLPPLPFPSPSLPSLSLPLSLLSLVLYDVCLVWSLQDHIAANMVDKEEMEAYRKAAEERVCYTCLIAHAFPE